MRAGECLFFAAVREDDRNASGGCFSGLRHGATTSAVNHGHVAADKIGRQRQQKIALLAAPAVIDLDVLSFDIAGFAKALAKCCQRARLRGGSALGEKAIGCCARAGSGPDFNYPRLDAGSRPPPLPALLTIAPRR